MQEDWLKCVNWKQLEIGLQKYVRIMASFEELNSGTLWENLKYTELRKRFNHFYRVRRGEEFQQEFYNLLLVNRDSDVSFEDVFTAIKMRTKRVEASFSSKLLATINPHKPIWDTEVLKKLNMKAPYQADRNRESKIINCYLTIEDWYTNELHSARGKEMIRTFDKKMGRYNITDTKKIDLMLWQKDR